MARDANEDNDVLLGTIKVSKPVTQCDEARRIAADVAKLSEFAAKRKAPVEEDRGFVLESDPGDRFTSARLRRY